MPQFDNFSFFSQLFWTLSFFLLFFLSTSYFLLPALGIILKVRKRILAVGGTKDLSTVALSNRFQVNTFGAICYDTISTEESAYGVFGLSWPNISTCCPSVFVLLKNDSLRFVQRIFEFRAISVL